MNWEAVNEAKKALREHIRECADICTADEYNGKPFPVSVQDDGRRSAKALVALDFLSGEVISLQIKLRKYEKDDASATE